MDQRVPGHGQKLAAQLGVSDQQLEGEASLTHTSENVQAMSRVPQIANMVFKGASKWLKNRKRRKFEKDENKRYRKDNAGNHFVQDTQGNVDLGNPFNDIADDELHKAGLKRLSVRLERGEHYVKPDGRPGGHGDVHITPQHEQQILDMVDENGTPLFDDVADYVDFVSNHWTEVRQGKDGSPILVVRDPSVVKLSGKQNVMILELKETDMAGFYSHKTAAPMDNRYLRKYKVLLERGGEVMAPRHASRSTTCSVTERTFQVTRPNVLENTVTHRARSSALHPEGSTTCGTTRIDLHPLREVVKEVTAMAILSWWCAIRQSSTPMASKM